MMMKYRVSEVAKDFNVPSKEIIELLAKYIDTPKKSMTALEESELDLIFEHYTQKYQTENFDAYYATAKEKKEEPAPAASEAAATAAPAKSIAQMPGKITPARPASAAGQPVFSESLSFSSCVPSASGILSSGASSCAPRRNV